MFKFLHAADIHLDSPLRGLERYDGAPVDEIRLASRQALAKLVQWAISEPVEFLIISGDLYDGDWRDYNTGLFFSKLMSQLREANIRVFVIAGNHDAASQINRTLRMPENVTVFSSQAPETEFLDDLGVALHGQSFPRRAVMKDMSVEYPHAFPNMFNIGLLHTCAEGREGHEPYAPCKLDGLRFKGYQYWALGHVHRREILAEDPWIVFPGNLQGRHIRESGAKGATLVTVDGQTVHSVEHRSFDVMRWETCDVDVSGAEDSDVLLERSSQQISAIFAEHDEHLLAVRLHLKGPCKAHHDLVENPDHWINEIRASATDQTGGKVWVEQVKFQTQTEINLEEWLQRDDPIGGLLRSLNGKTWSDAEIQELMQDFLELQRKIPSELQYGPDAIELKEPEKFLNLLNDLQHFLLPRLY